MKKALLLAFLGISVCLQASAVVWGLDDVGEVTASPTIGTNIGDYTAYLCLSGTNYSASDALSTIKAGKWDSATWSIASKGMDEYEGVYYIDNTTSSTITEMTSGTYMMYIVVMDDAGEWATVSSEKECSVINPPEQAVKNLWTSDELIAVSSQDPNSVNGWVSVPEPTALALLALGVAGLALKRKNV